MRRVAGRSKTAALPEELCENAWSFTALEAVGIMWVSAERKGSVLQHGTVVGHSPESTPRGSPQASDSAGDRDALDFGHALVKMGGVLRKVCFFVMTLPYSDAFFVRAYERECTETFWDGHVGAFAFFGGVPRRIAYDNSKIAVAQILGPRLRELTAGFLQLVSHYLFGYHFCLVRRANEKGVVEGLVRYSRQNFLVPVPQVRDFEELNAYLLTRCREDLRQRVRGQTRIKEQLLAEEQLSLQCCATAWKPTWSTGPGNTSGCCVSWRRTGWRT